MNLAHHQRPNMKNIDLSAGGASAQLSNRAKELVSSVLGRYKAEVRQLKANQVLQLGCYFEGIEVFPDMLGVFDEHTIEIGVYQRAKDGSITKKAEWFVPVQRLSFRMSVVPKSAHKPPKEIGFHTGKEREK
jgi:hypothetical protein